MLPFREGFLAVALLSGIGLCCLGVYSYRRWDEPGTAPFAAVAGILGLGAIAGTVAAISQGATVPETVVPQWADIGLVAWSIAMVPWFVFALQYTGRRLEFSWRTIAALSAPIAGIIILLVIRTANVIGMSVVTQIFGTLSLLYMFALVTVGSYLLMRTTYEYGHLSVLQGVCLTLGGIAPLALLNTISTLAGETADVVVFGVYASAFVVPVVGFSLAVLKYGTFESTPATGTLGERAIPRETDDLVFVVDSDDRIIKLNRRAAEELADSPSAPLGESFETLTGRSVSALAAADTVELETPSGRRTFDAQVTAFTDQHDRQLGSLLSLRDVTDRELRKQRLEVLNRVLRHNLRNRIDVIKSNAEAIRAEMGSHHAVTIRNSADQLEELSATARATDRLLSRRPRTSNGDLSDAVRNVIPSDVEPTVTLDLPETAPLVTDWEALDRALESAIRNAIKHARESVGITVEEVPQGFAVRISDDGPGIPDAELDSLDAETETQLQHSTGLDLWQLKWAVTKANGNLSFETGDGTTVRITIPDQNT